MLNRSNASWSRSIWIRIAHRSNVLIAEHCKLSCKLCRKRHLFRIQAVGKHLYTKKFKALFNFFRNTRNTFRFKILRLAYLSSILLILYSIFHYIMQNFHLHLSSKRFKRLRTAFQYCESIDTKHVNEVPRFGFQWRSRECSKVDHDEQTSLAPYVSIVSVCVTQRDTTRTSRSHCYVSTVPYCEWKLFGYLIV